MNIVVTGASGFIGSHLVQALSRAGHTVVACVRDTRAAHRRWSSTLPDLKIIQGDFYNDHDASVWQPRLNNIDIVINAVGIIRESGKHTFEALHTLAPCALFLACQKAGVKRVIQISALGADDTALSQYHLSKRAADDCLMSLAMDWVIMMPSIVYGPGAKSMALFKAMAALPVIPLIDSGDQPVQPIHINDLCRGVMQLVEQENPCKLRIEMVGPEPVTMKDIHTQLREWLALGKARFISVPYSFAITGAQLSGFLGNRFLRKRVLKNSPPASQSTSVETLEMLRNGNTGDVRPFVKQFGFMPMSFEYALRETPAQQADFWQASLFVLQPLLRYSIAFIWIFTGVMSAFIFPAEQSYAMLAKANIVGNTAIVMLYGAAATDLALGIATLCAYRLRVVGLCQISIILLYTVVISFSQPEQWVHPFGPVSKNIPLIVATLIMVALARRR